MLGVLQNGLRAKRLDQGSHLFSLMSHYNDSFLCAQRSTGTQHLLHQRPPSRTVQDFGKAGLEPGAFSGRKNHYGEVFRWHGLEIHSAGDFRISQRGDFAGESKG
jgi:hypothetical protein